VPFFPTPEDDADPLEGEVAQDGLMSLFADIFSLPVATL
jgi:hypothetical protein